MENCLFSFLVPRKIESQNLLSFHDIGVALPQFTGLDGPVVLLLLFFSRRELLHDLRPVDIRVGGGRGQDGGHGRADFRCGVWLSHGSEFSLSFIVRSK